MPAAADNDLYANTTGNTINSSFVGAPYLNRRHVIVRRDNSTTESFIDDEPEADFHNTDTSDETNDLVTNGATNADGSEYQDDASQALALSADAGAQDSDAFTTLIDSQKNFQIAPAQDGNLYAIAYSGGSTSDVGLFAWVKNIIFGDDQDRVLLYYPEEIGAYNASRIRLAPESAVPKTAQVITLSQIPGSSVSCATYFALSLEEKIFNLVLCNFDNGAASKVFIVSGQSGLDSLQKNPQLRYTITGAPVSDCAPLALVNGGNGVV